MAITSFFNVQKVTSKQAHTNKNGQQHLKALSALTWEYYGAGIRSSMLIHAVKFQHCIS